MVLPLPSFHSKGTDVGSLGQGSWVRSDPMARWLSQMEGEPFLGFVSVLPSLPAMRW